MELQLASRRELKDAKSLKNLIKLEKKDDSQESLGADTLRHQNINKLREAVTRMQRWFRAVQLKKFAGELQKALNTISARLAHVLNETEKLRPKRTQLPKSEQLFLAVSEGNLLEVATLVEDEPRNLATLDDSKAEHQAFILDPGYKNPKEGKTALMEAASKGYYDIIKYLLSKSDWRKVIAATDDFGATALMHAAGKGHFAIVCLLHQYEARVHDQDLDGWNALIFAADGGNWLVVDYLIYNAKMDVSVTTKFVETALHKAAANGHLEIVKCLSVQEANINAQNRDGMTALLLACYYGQIDVVKYLVQNNSVKDLPNRNGETAATIEPSVYAVQRYQQIIGGSFDEMRDLIKQELWKSIRKNLAVLGDHLLDNLKIGSYADTMRKRQEVVPGDKVQRFYFEGDRLLHQGQYEAALFMYEQAKTLNGGQGRLIKDMKGVEHDPELIAQKMKSHFFSQLDRLRTIRRRKTAEYQFTTAMEYINANQMAQAIPRLHVAQEQLRYISMEGKQMIIDPDLFQKVSDALKREHVSDTKKAAASKPAGSRLEDRWSCW